ncbi:prepilin-type N-terminal cleavage/methylation domain-containing protein [Paenibacillus whitsoniae]|uniref:Prepilin-type N-terminal cleavage/methylation domain-containing protein n=1 Tax=Paenibacillus whitsoniae TaxID=2496558 RepID=A0A3S0CPQ1_9BACL|nr:prepilin-type N-terminal cleavage/methylation domain-containing protein [Paenibacillus whitsoniae]RTE01415.1 prepilin-type N-terminal cleavage/methylation domain-containing protein [Paenibacillus whitsoniae]
MNPFVKLWREDNGLSLIELIAVLTILSMVMGTIYGVITYGFTAYNKVTVENSLRDEADTVMSAIMTEMYTVGPTTIESIPNENGIQLTRKEITGNTITANSQIYLEAPDAEGLETKTQVVMGDYTKNPPERNIVEIKSDLNGSRIQLECNGIVSCNSGLIVVDLHLQQTDNKGVVHILNLKSRFGF